MNDARHAEITKVMTSQGPYGTGVFPNPFLLRQDEMRRRNDQARVLQLLTHKIEALTEPRFITSHETAEFIEALITMTDSRRILEIGTCTGYGTLHMLRAVYGKPGASVVSIDARPAHDKAFWARDEFKGVLEHVEGWTPQILSQLKSPRQIANRETFDLVFIDSDHSVEHTEKELVELWNLTRPGSLLLFHDVPQWQSPENRTPPPVREWLLRHPQLEGLCLRSCRQLDGIETWGPDYPMECSPGLGVFIRK